MKYEEIRLLKQSEKSVIRLVKERDSEQVMVQKVIKGHLPVYITLKDCSHPYLPKIYEVTFTESETTILEEYIPGGSLGTVNLTERQLITAAKELCSVLEYIHGKGIIHRDIKPSNILLGEDGHIRLTDFDAARMPKDDLEQDTRLLGTRGYAPPEQYGFSQTDGRADIYAMGVTLGQLLGEKAQRRRYVRILAKCTNLDPDRRYQTAREVKHALSFRNRMFALGVGMVALCGLLIWAVPRLVPTVEPPAPETSSKPVSSQPEELTPAGEESESDGLKVLPAPKSPHWDGETGIGVWGNVPKSGVNGKVEYRWKIYRRDSETAIDLETDKAQSRSSMRGTGGIDESNSTYRVNLSSFLTKNGVYYFAVAAAGDQVTYADSPYVLSDAFYFTGEDAPYLPVPTGLRYVEMEGGTGWNSCVTWDNLDDYAIQDSFRVRVYNQQGERLISDVWTKEDILDKRGYMWVNNDAINKKDGPYRFTVQALSSRPNEYRSMPEISSSDESAFSPWFEVTVERNYPLDP